MIAANLSMLSSIAKEFHGHGLSHQELCQEGARGLVKSTEKFDVSHKAKFSTYSYYWIRERMFAAVQKFQSILMDGRSLRRRVAFILSCKEEFHKIKGRNPSIDELSTISNIDIIKIRQTFFSVRSVRRPVESKYNDKHTGWEQIQGPESQSPWRGIWHNELKMELQVLFRTLSPRELQVLSLRYGLHGDEPLSLFQTAALLKLTHEAVRKSEKHAFDKVRKLATESGLQHYLCRISN
ncbi:hypothetical protein KP509_23G063000 [Ceratopteris richardii]|nr:hypothetical protein KP509_23G063000 [Ceratopteris richardii]